VHIAIIATTIGCWPNRALDVAQKPLEMRKWVAAVFVLGALAAAEDQAAPETQTDEERYATQLQQLAEEDPSIMTSLQHIYEGGILNVSNRNEYVFTKPHPLSVPLVSLCLMLKRPSLFCSMSGMGTYHGCQCEPRAGPDPTDVVSRTIEGQLFTFSWKLFTISFKAFWHQHYRRLFPRTFTAVLSLASTTLFFAATSLSSRRSQGSLGQMAQLQSPRTSQLLHFRPAPQPLFCLQQGFLRSRDPSQPLVGHGKLCRIRAYVVYLETCHRLRARCQSHPSYLPIATPTSICELVLVTLQVRRMLRRLRLTEPRHTQVRSR
jgi:hypothetical protein